MAIQLEYISFFVSIETIKQKYPGGWEQCLIDHKSLIGGRVWFDEHLFRDGAMNPADIHYLIKEWQALGFHTHEDGESPSKWVDVCVVESLFGSTLPCNWIEIEDYSAFYKGHSKGEVIGRDSFAE